MKISKISINLLMVRSYQRPAKLNLIWRNHMSFSSTLIKKFIIAGICCLSGNLWAAGNLSLTTGEWAPYTGEQLKNKGFTSEIVTKSLEAEGYKVDIAFKAWKKAQTLAKKKPKKFQGSYPWFSTDERKKDFLYSDKIMETINIFLVKKGSNLSKIDNLEALKGKNVGASLGYSYGSDFDKAMKNGQLKIVKVKSDTEGVKQLIDGKIDVFPLEKYVAKSFIAEQKIQDKVQVVESSFFKPTSVHFIVSKKHDSGQELITKFNAGLSKIRKNGTYQKIIDEAFK